jgi:hypothetical protein
MDDSLALDGGGAATKWQRQHAARQRAKLAKQHRAEARAAKQAASREAKADLRKRKAKWLAGWKRKAAAAKAAGLPKPSKKGSPWRTGLEHSQVVDMTGKTFGRLTVIRSAPISLTMRTSQRCRVWVVKCSCGSREKMVNGTSLRQGNVKSCGCLHVERLRATKGKKKSRTILREKLEAAPLTIQLNELRRRILAGKVTNHDAKLLTKLRPILIEEEVRIGVRRRYGSGRPMLLKSAGVRTRGRNRDTPLTLH